MKNFKKMWMNSLCFLDNSLIHTSILIILVLYASTIFNNINSYVGNLYNFSVVKLLILLLIVYVSPKDTSIAVLLAVSYVVSLIYMMNTENFDSIKRCSSGQVMNNEGQCVDGPKRCSSGQVMNDQGECVDGPKRCQSGQVMNEQGQCVEGFFPLMNTSENETHDTKDKAMMHNSDVKLDSSCMQSYVPRFETVGDVCSPTATFKNELNAQGLNSPEGYNQMGANGSPLV